MRRGYIQGIHAFGSLAVNFMLEGVVRLGGAFLLIRLGLGVKGAVLASVIAVIASYFAGEAKPLAAAISKAPLHPDLLRGRVAGDCVFLRPGSHQQLRHCVGEALLRLRPSRNLCRRLAGRTAGEYVRVVGGEYHVSGVGGGALQRSGSPARVVHVAGHGVPDSGGIDSGTLGDAKLLVEASFGAHFELGNYGGLAALLILYAVTTGIYSLSSVMITYEMSRKIANTSWAQLAFSGALVLGICVFHQTLRQVIFVQLC